MAERKTRKRGTVVQKATLRARKAGRVFENVEVRLVKKRPGHRWEEELPDVPYNSEMYFKIEVDYLGKGKHRVEVNLNLTHTDPNALVEKANAKLDELLTIGWQDVLYVTVEQRPGFSKKSEGFMFKWEPYQIGKRAGEDVYRALERSPVYIHTGTLDVGDDAGRFHDERAVHSVIPDTSGNREALIAIATAVKAVRERLGELLSPKMIEGTLADMSLFQIPVSTAPVKKKARRKAKKRTKTQRVCRSPAE
jgi:hypothetical protein